MNLLVTFLLAFAFVSYTAGRSLPSVEYEVDDSPEGNFSSTKCRLSNNFRCWERRNNPFDVSNNGDLSPEDDSGIIVPVEDMVMETLPPRPARTGGKKKNRGGRKLRKNKKRGKGRKKKSRGRKRGKKQGRSRKAKKRLNRMQTKPRKGGRNRANTRHKVGNAFRRKNEKQKEPVEYEFDDADTNVVEVPQELPQAKLGSSGNSEVGFSNKISKYEIPDSLLDLDLDGITQCEAIKMFCDIPELRKFINTLIMEEYTDPEVCVEGGDALCEMIQKGMDCEVALTQRLK